MTRPITLAATAIGIAILLVAAANFYYQVGAANAGLFGALRGVVSGNAEGGGAGIEMVLIDVPACIGCLDFSGAFAAVNSTVGGGVAYREIESTDAEAAAIVARANITRLPAFYVSGDAAKVSAVAARFGSVPKNGAYAYESPTAPYYSVAEGRIVGLVKIVMVSDPSCTNCYDASAIPAVFAQQGVRVEENLSYAHNSTEGAAVLSRFGLATVPAIIVNSEINYYPELAASIAQFSAANADGSYSMKIGVPFRNLSSGEVRGLVNATFLNDSSCAECYNVTIHEAAFTNFGVVVVNRTYVDVSSAEGRALVARYNITEVPAIVLSPDASLYYGLLAVWPSVGSIEADGYFVFRNDSAVGTYRNLASGQVVPVSTPESGG